MNSDCLQIVLFLLIGWLLSGWIMSMLSIVSYGWTRGFVVAWAAIIITMLV